MQPIQILGAVFLLLPCLSQAAEETQQGCINVEINGYKALSYECLSEQLANPQGAAAARANQAAMNVPIERRPANQLGLYNQSATRIRMGNTFGKSAQAQRPAP